MKENNIIDLSQRRMKGASASRLESLKLRIDIEQAKVLVTTSLVSVLFLVTLANNSLMSAPDVTVDGQAAMSSEETGSRGIASIPTGTSDWEDEMVARLAKTELSTTEQVGRRPTSLDRLTLEFLEGKYAVRLENGKIRELEFSNSSGSADRPKQLTDRRQFLEDNRDLLPVSFAKPVKKESAQNGQEMIESYDLVNKADVPVAKVQFYLDPAGRLLKMEVTVSRLASL